MFSFPRRAIIIDLSFNSYSLLREEIWANMISLILERPKTSIMRVRNTMFIIFRVTRCGCDLVYNYCVFPSVIFTFQSFVPHNECRHLRSCPCSFCFSSRSRSKEMRKDRYLSLFNRWRRNKPLESCRTDTAESCKVNHSFFFFK